MPRSVSGVSGPDMDTRLKGGADAPISAEGTADSMEADNGLTSGRRQQRSPRKGKARLIIASALTAVFLIALASLGVGLLRGIALPVAATHQVEAALSAARGGRAVHIGQLHMVFAEGALRLRARNVISEDGAAQATSRPVQIDVSLSGRALLQGRVRVLRADVSGGDLSITLRRTGEIALAFGQPGTAPDLLLPATDPSVPLAARSRAWLTALAKALEEGGRNERLARVRINRSRLHLIDERSGAIWLAQDASMQFLQAEERVEVSAQATLVRAHDSARFSFSVTSGSGLRDAHVQLELEDALLRFLLGPQSPVQAVQAPFRAKLDARVDRERGIKTLSIAADAGDGALAIGPDSLAFTGAHLEGAYALASDTFIFRRIEILGKDLSIRAQGAINDLGALFSGPSAEGLRFNLDMPELTFASASFASPVRLLDVNMLGRWVPDAREVTVDDFAARLAESKIKASGQIYWEKIASGLRPGAKAHAEISGMLHPADIISLWPVTLAEEARHWFVTSVFAADIAGATISLDLKPADLAEGKFSPDALRVRFPVANAKVQVVEGMSLLREASGSTEIAGRSLRVDVAGGKLGDLAISKGEVWLPELSQAGRAFVKASASGDARSVVGLILETPLEVRDRLPFEPDSITGRGSLELSLSRPLHAGATAKDIPFTVAGRFEGVGAVSRQGDIRIADWKLLVDGDERGLRLWGPLRFGGSEANLDWYERFGDEVIKNRSRYEIRGRLLTPDLDLLGIPARGFAQGTVGVIAKARGEGLVFSEADVDLDLTESEITLPENIWRKPPGAPASIVLRATRSSDGTVETPALQVTGPGLRIRGQARFGQDNRLLSLQTDALKIGDRYDLNVKAGRSSDGALLLTAQGALFDATPFLPQGVSEAAAKPASKPGAALDIRVDAEKLLLRKGAQVRDASVRIVNREGNLDELYVQGLDPAGLPFRASLSAGNTPSLRQIDLQTEDLGFAVQALIGDSPIRGGRGNARGYWDKQTQLGKVDLHVERFKVADLPLAAKVFSSVASLQAFSDLVNGEGLGFEKLDAAFTMADNQVRLGKGQASGPSIGVTASGSYDIASQRVEANGVLVPAYRVNSALGQIPGLGRVFTSRKGEGVLGFTYTIRGTADRARIAVNPLSGLAPGFLRRLFEPQQEAVPADQGRQTQDRPAVAASASP